MRTCMYLRAWVRVCGRMCVSMCVRMCVCDCTDVMVRMFAYVCALAGWRTCVRACAYICMYDYYIILLYMRVQCVRACVGMRLRTCMCVLHANIYAHVSAGACA